MKTNHQNTNAMIESIFEIVFIGLLLLAALAVIITDIICGDFREIFFWVFMAVAMTAAIKFLYDDIKHNRL
jgi:hypothetical protein